MIPSASFIGLFASSFFYSIHSFGKSLAVVIKLYTQGLMTWNI